MAADCEMPDKCRFCGEEGHKAGDCTGAKTHKITKEDGTESEIYIPTEVRILIYIFFMAAKLQHSCYVFPDD